MENTQKPFLSHTEKFFFFFSSSSSSPSPPFWVLLYSPEMVWCISGVSEDSRNALNATVATLSGQCAVWIGRGERERESHKELANRKFVGLPAMRAPRTMQVAQFTVAALASCGREPLAVSLSLFPLVYFALIYHRDIIPLDSIAKIPWQAAAGGIVNRPVRIPSHSRDRQTEPTVAPCVSGTNETWLTTALANSIPLQWSFDRIQTTGESKRGHLANVTKWYRKFHSFHCGWLQIWICNL